MFSLWYIDGMNRLRIKDFLPPGHRCYVAVSRLEAPSMPPHTHDFDEVFWVERGQGTHLLNGKNFDLRPGLLVPIRAGDRHALYPSAAGALDIVNIAFAASSQRELRARYGLRDDDPWRAAEAQRHYCLSGMAAGLLRQYAQELIEGARSAFALDRFLLNLYHVVRLQQSHNQSEGMPDWLAYACREMEQPNHLERGTPALVELAGRSPEHVCRAMRRFTGQSPTDFINRLRMAAIARRLAQSREPISELASEVGLSNLAHFYTLFRKRFGMTPRQYRLREQMITGHNG